MTIHFHEHDNDEYAITFAAGDYAAVNDVVEAADNDVNGRFWRSFAEYQWPELTKRVGFDCESDYFVAYSDDKDALLEFQAAWEAILSDSAKVAEVLARAESTGIRLAD